MNGLPCGISILAYTGLWSYPKQFIFDKETKWGEILFFGLTLVFLSSVSFPLWQLMPKSNPSIKTILSERWKHPFTVFCVFMILSQRLSGGLLSFQHWYLTGKSIFWEVVLCAIDYWTSFLASTDEIRGTVTSPSCHHPMLSNVSYGQLRTPRQGNRKRGKISLL